MRYATLLLALLSALVSGACADGEKGADGDALVAFLWTSDVTSVDASGIGIDSVMQFDGTESTLYQVVDNGALIWVSDGATYTVTTEFEWAKGQDGNPGLLPLVPGENGDPGKDHGYAVLLSGSTYTQELGK